MGEIFATSRWSKALININQYRKTLNLRSKDLKSDLKVFENNKEVAHKLTDDLLKTKKRMAEYVDKHTAMQQQIQALHAKIAPLRQAHKALHSFESKKRVFENDIAHLRAQQKSAHERMSAEYEETDDELQGFLTDFDDQIVAKEQELKRIKSEYEQTNAELRQKKENLQQLHQKRGKIQQIIEDNKNKQRELLALINKFI